MYAVLISHDNSKTGELSLYAKNGDYLTSKSPVELSENIPVCECNVVLVNHGKLTREKHFLLLNVPDKDGLIELSGTKQVLNELTNIAEKQGFNCENKKDFELKVIRV